MARPPDAPSNLGPFIPRPEKLLSAILIGFVPTDLQRAKLKEMGVELLSVEEALSLHSLQAGYIGAPISLPEVQKEGIRRLVKFEPKPAFSFDLEAVIRMLEHKFAGLRGAPR